MPRLSKFFGILIYMYYDDHNPPHFHAQYGKHEVQINLSTMAVIKGSLPRPQLSFVTTWGYLHQGELLEAWAATKAGKRPKKIAPLKKGKL